MTETIGISKQKERLYYCSDKLDDPKVLPSCLRSESSSSTSQIWIQHKHMGDAPFYIIKFMFPSLFLIHSIKPLSLMFVIYQKPNLSLFFPVSI